MAALAVAVGALVVALHAVSPSAGPPPRPAADAKRTCVYSANRVDQLAAFDRLTGVRVDCAVVYNDAAATWQDWQDAWFVRAGPDQPQSQWPSWVARDRARRLLVITQSLVPSGVPADWRARGAAGMYDDHIRTLLGHYVSAGLGGSVIRLAHEANGDWYTDDIGSTPAQYAQWRAYWRHFVAVARTVPGAHFTFDLSVNPGYRPIPLASYYPGDDVVDVIGVDVYDDAPRSVGRAQPARWVHQWSEPLGVRSIARFAALHDKPLSVPEWGQRSGTTALGAGDDPYFVDRIAALVGSQPTMYQAYFDSTTEGALPLARTPLGLAAWKAHYAAGG